MNEHIRAILTHGGVESSASTEEDLLSVLESWLGLPETNSWEDQMMEDIAPFDAPFYQALERLLVSIWQPDESTIMVPSNMLMEVDCDPKDISLYKAMAVVRVTRLLRFWLDLNCTGSSVMRDTNDEEKGLSDLLLQHCSCEESTGKPRRYPLVQAVYYHIERLPQLQSQINNYTQSLKRGERNCSGKALTNPQSRLSQHQEALQVAAKLNSEWNDHVEALEYIIGQWYSVGNVDVRRQCRSHLGSAWSQFVSGSGSGMGGIKLENTSSSGIRMTLRVLHRILQGTGGTLQKSHEYLLTHHLIPLHKPNSMVLWRDQTSLLELYHEPLVQCVAILLQKKPEWIPKAITALLEPDIWTVGGNTPKLVLLLHEIDMYIGILPDSVNFSTMPRESFAKLLHTLGSCMASDHSRLAERALSFMKNKKLQSLIQVHFEFSLSLLLPFLVRSEPAWNPTVRKMTYTVLKTFQDFDNDRFLRIGAKCFPSDGASSHSSIATVVPRAKTTGSVILQSQDGATEKPKDFSLKSAMGGWKPPMSTGARVPSGRNSAMPPPSSRVPRAGAAPPLTVTGVAPWSMKSTALSNKSAKNPPLGVTGVVPWAVQEKVHMSGKRRAGEALSDVTEDDRPEESRVLAYMELIKPPEELEGASVWARTQMAETPTLLPNLKFHDLVFGHDLGEGAFGSVRYARFIDRTRTRSQWPEYAVKIISTEKIKEMGYEASVQREVAVLRILSHPGIARLVSSFRFREGVYLVLEYASGGDLHSVLRKNGSLDHASTRFVMGEIVAALASIHELGLIYGDLKPENIVITEQGHAKLTDFGACRAITQEAKRMIGDVAKNILNELRDGDWKPQSKRKEKDFDMDEDDEEMKDNNSESRYLTDDDLRIEGTTAYLPPEVVMGGFPTPAADSWALGCVLYLCLSGRPPIIEDDETLIKHRIVSFDVGKPESSHASLLFSETHAAGIESDARHLIIGLFNKNAAERPNMAQIAQHEFFRNEGTDVFTLYRHPAPPLDVGDVSPVEDAKWSRRQYSTIWAPQPQAYDVSLSTVDSGTQNHTSLSSGPIPEGVEATAFFSASTSASRYATDKVPRPALKRPIEE
jgi:serine/threonine protein kinase